MKESLDFGIAFSNFRIYSNLIRTWTIHIDKMMEQWKTNF